MSTVTSTFSTPRVLNYQGLTVPPRHVRRHEHPGRHARRAGGSRDGDIEAYRISVLAETGAYPGIGALLQGRAVWHRASGGGVTGNTYEHASPGDPLREPDYGFDSLSRFTATVEDGNGEPVTFVLTRDGLQWKLTDIRLPISAVD